MAVYPSPVKGPVCKTGIRWFKSSYRLQKIIKIWRKIIMSEITKEKIVKVSESTGFGLDTCEKALLRNNSNINKSIRYLWTACHSDYLNNVCTISY